MKRARFVAPAWRDFLLEVDFYKTQEPGLASRFVSAVESATVRAVSFPRAGMALASGMRRVFVKGFPFSLIYREDSEGVVVFALAHHSRRPDYWKSRVQDR